MSKALGIGLGVLLGSGSHRTVHLELAAAHGRLHRHRLLSVEELRL
jgi:hypothetical protein